MRSRTSGGDPRARWRARMEARSTTPRGRARRREPSRAPKEQILPCLWFCTASDPDREARPVSPHSVPSLHDLEHGLPFVDRHVGPRPDELATMLATIGVASLDELADRA